jgi:Uri superfamily endonuclease
MGQPMPGEPIEDGLNSTPGTYVLVVNLDQPANIRVGKRSSQQFRSGYYLYVGSAFGPGGLKSRVGRHIRSEKKMRWHIDYLLPHTNLCWLWYLPMQRLECTWSQAIATIEAANPITGFGASDCRCSSHLYHFQSVPEIDLKPSPLIALIDC